MTKRRVAPRNPSVCTAFPLDGASLDRSSADPVLLDVTRLVALRWSGRQPTGIDRVALAYMRHFRPRAHAVVQHRRIIRTLSLPQSEELFAMLDAPQRNPRARLTRALSAPLVSVSAARKGQAGRAYLNVGHTDFDLPVHHNWVRRQGLRAFYLLHDLIPILHPEFSRPPAVARHLGRVRGAAAHGAGIIVTSASVEAELRAFAAAQGVPLPPVVTVHLAGAELPAAPAAAMAAPPRPFFLCLGTIEPRKNHRLLLEVWQRLAASMGAATPRLIIAGQAGPMTGDLLGPLASDSCLRAHVEHRPACSDDDLAQLLHNAAALLMPSLAEGFGLPFVEALQAGTKVIASDLPVFRELGQGAAQLLDPYDAAIWEQAISTAASGSDTGRSGLPGYIAPSWANHFAVVDRFIASPTLPTPSCRERDIAA